MDGRCFVSLVEIYIQGFSKLQISAAKVTNFGLPKSLDCVPDENIWKESAGLCLRWNNLKFIDGK